MELGEVETLVNELDTRVDRLRSLYEQYFMGIERMEPAVARKDVERRVQTLRKEQIRNTALRFKFQTILQRYNTYQTYWMRICRQIEEGTYRRDLLRATARFGDPRRRGQRLSEQPVEAAKTSSAPPEGAAAASALPSDAAKALPPMRAPAPSAPGEELDSGWDMDEAPTAAVARPVKPVPPGVPPLPPRAGARRPNDPDASASDKRAAPSPDDDDDDRETGRAPKLRNAPPVPPIPAPPAVPDARPGAAARAPGMRVAPPPPPPPFARPAPEDAAEARLRAVYTQYVETRKKQNESTASLTYESLATTLRASAAQLRAKHGAQRTVDFEVVVREGRTVLRPIVR